MDCLDNLLPDGEICPKCGGKRVPSALGWIHATGPKQVPIAREYIFTIEVKATGKDQGEAWNKVYSERFKGLKITKVAEGPFLWE